MVQCSVLRQVQCQGQCPHSALAELSESMHRCNVYTQAHKSALAQPFAYGVQFRRNMRSYTPAFIVLIAVQSELLAQTHKLLLTHAHHAGLLPNRSPSKH